MKFLYLVIQLLMLDVIDLSESSLEVLDDYNYVDYGIYIAEPEPLQGAVWPTPRTESKGDMVYKINTTLNFNFNIAFSSNDVLANIRDRFLDRLRTLRKYSNEIYNVDISGAYVGDINLIKIYLKTRSEHYPHHGMSEYYKLKIRTNITINSYDVWGVIRALDTLLQLCYTDEFGTLFINRNEIEDAPKYSHRGLMLDTETHFISVDNILKIVDAMAMNKLNAFHWRIVGDTSFPYESSAFPELSEKGAFNPKMVYNASTIKKIYEFARNRGVMVIPEINVPGHVRSIGKSHPEMLTPCYSAGPATGPLDPRSSAASVVYTLLQEISALVLNTSVHLGGEDIDTDCWASNPEVQDYIKNKGIKYNLHLHFLQNIDRRIARQLIVAQDILKCEQAIKHWETDTLVVQAYSEDLYQQVKHISNYSVILSWPWDLSKRINKETSLFDMYHEAAEAIDKIMANLLAGGEAYMINASADDTNIFDIVWPRISVMADVLWHGLDEANDVSEEATYDHVQRTIHRQTCRMVRFGIPASPPGPGYCVVYNKEKKSKRKSRPKTKVHSEKNKAKPRLRSNTIKHHQENINTTKKT